MALPSFFVYLVEESKDTVQSVKPTKITVYVMFSSRIKTFLY